MPTNRVSPLHFLQVGPLIRSPVMTSIVNINPITRRFSKIVNKNPNMYLHRCQLYKLLLDVL